LLVSGQGACPSTSAFLLSAGRCFARYGVGRLSGEVRRGKGARRLAALSYRFGNATGLSNQKLPKFD
jgi:hypothetical protein